LTPPSWVVEVVDVDGEIVVGGPGRIVGEGSVVLVLEVVVVSGAAASALSAALPGLAFAPMLGAAPESVADALICAPLIGRATYRLPSNPTLTVPPGDTSMGKPADCAPSRLSRTWPPFGNASTTAPGWGDSTPTRTVPDAFASPVPG